jgi:hypothetical protein
MSTPCCQTIIQEVAAGGSTFSQVYRAKERQDHRCAASILKNIRNSN